MLWPYCSIDLLARNQRNSHTQMVILKLFPKNKIKAEFYFLSTDVTFVMRVTLVLPTMIFNSQNRASCRNIFNGFKRNASIMQTRTNGFTYGGMLKLALYKKLNKLRVHITPRTAASSIRCCSDK